MEDKNLNSEAHRANMSGANPEPLFEYADDDAVEEVVVLDAASHARTDEPAEKVPVNTSVKPSSQSIPEAPAQTYVTAIQEEFPTQNFSRFDLPVEEPLPAFVPQQDNTAPLSETTFNTEPIVHPTPPSVQNTVPAPDDTMVFPLPDQAAYAESMALDFSDEASPLQPSQTWETAAPQAAEISGYNTIETAVNGTDEDAVSEPSAADSSSGETPAAPTDQPRTVSKTSRPVRKSRPKRKKGDGLLGIPHLLATFVWLAIILFISVSLGRMLWLCAADVLAFGRENKEVVITIKTNDTVDDIAQKLHDKGLINYPGLFKLYADIAVDDGDIAPGTYTLNTILDYHALVGSMSSSSSNRAVVEDVLIPEGYSCRQIFELLEQNGICTVAELEEYAANGEFQEFWFLEGVKRGDKYCLEGFLFPDTYDFYAGSTPREALGKMLLGFNSRILQEELTPKLEALNERLSAMMKANGCSQELIEENQIGLYELLTVASLIEEETAGASESPNIASVIFNRLTENEVFERYLGIDAAIIYATGDAENIDTGIDSPYNTYTNAGLTPTPISNPGLSSINATLEFADTDYYYYVLNPETQLHQFSKTYEEHQKWIEKFRGE